MKGVSFFNKTTNKTQYEYDTKEILKQKNYSLDFNKYVWNIYFLQLYIILMAFMKHSMNKNRLFL